MFNRILNSLVTMFNILEIKWCSSECQRTTSDGRSVWFISIDMVNDMS